MTTGLYLIGYGNPARGDDGLGPAFAEAIDRLGIPRVSVYCDFQLTAADAASLAPHRLALFVDAAENGPAPFFVRRLLPAESASVASHAISPEAVLALAQSLYGARPEAYLIGIRGYEFGRHGTGLSALAAENLAAALERVTPVLRQGRVEGLALADELGDAVELSPR